jgi:hypothetical protein
MIRQLGAGVRAAADTAMADGEAEILAARSD